MEDQSASTPTQRDISGVPRRKIWLDSGVYLVTGFVQRAGGLLLIPFLVATLSPADFTRFGLFVSLLGLLPRTLSVNVHSAPTRLLFDFKRADDRASLLVTTLAAAVGATTLILGAALGVVRVIKLSDAVTLGSLLIQLAICLGVVCTICLEFGLAVLRIYRESFKFSLLATVKSFGIVAAYVVAIMVVPGSYFLVVCVYAVVLVGVALLSFRLVHRQMGGGRWRIELLRPALKFSGPTVVNFVAIWLIGMSGRWIGAHYLPLERLADYTLLTILIGAVGMLGRALFDARIPDIGSKFAEGQYKNGFSVIRSTALAATVLVVIAYGFAFVAFNLFANWIPEGYHASNQLLAVALIAGLFDCVYLFGLQSLLASKRTDLQAAGTTISAVIVVGLSFALVQNLGSLGLVWAMALGYAVLATISWWLARRTYRQLVSERR